MAAQRKYPEELRERAVKMVSEIRERDGKGHGELARVGRQLGVHPEALRSWVKQAEIDGGERPGTTTGDKQRICELAQGQPGAQGQTCVPSPQNLRLDRPGNLGGSDSWEDAGPWRHSGSIRRSCASAR